MPDKARLAELRNALDEFMPGLWAVDSAERSGQPWHDGPIFSLVSHHGEHGIRVDLEIREDGDLDIHYYIPDRNPGWHEAHFPIPEEEMAEALRDGVRFIEDFVKERLVLGYDRGWFGGGRVFLRPEELTPQRRRGLAWTVSWRGTYDWSHP